MNKPAVKKTLKLAGSSGIKLANATKKVDTTSKPQSKESSPAPAPAASASTSASQEEKKEEKEAAATTPAATPETKRKLPHQQKPKRSYSTSAAKKESTPTPAAATKKESTPVSNSASVATADALVKEQEDEIDEEVVRICLVVKIMCLLYSWVTLMLVNLPWVVTFCI